MSTAVWIVMCSEPVMRAPLSGLRGPDSSRHAMRPGISTSASSISLRPHVGEREVGHLEVELRGDGHADSVLVMFVVLRLRRASADGEHARMSRRPARITG